MKPRIFTLFALVSLFSRLACQTDYEKGVDRLMWNSPTEALPYLESAIKADPSNEKAYLQLSVAYRQLDRMNEAFSVLKRGQANASAYPHLFAYDMGTIYESQGKNAFAEDLYSQAINANGSFASAFLNRAQVRFNLGKYGEAAEDYSAYLSLAPDSPKRADIERLIGLIRDSMAEEDKLKQEAARRKAEEEARKARLLSDVEESLRQAAEDTENVSEGVEGAEGYDSESELAD
jgi:tetratricopeptide (TPR) repeat protein